MIAHYDWRGDKEIQDRRFRTDEITPPHIIKSVRSPGGYFVPNLPESLIRLGVTFASMMTLDD